MKRCNIGGQAVIEGVMMKHRNQYAVAVRTPEGDIVVDKREYKSLGARYKWARLPLIRGIVNFLEAMMLGMQTLTYSASFYEEEENKESKVEKVVSNVFKQHAEAVVTSVTVLLAIVMAIGIFLILPWFAAEELGKVIRSAWAQVLVEGVLRIAIFVLYIFAISLTKDIKRVYMYHGAEHKVINCVENGLELTVEHAKAQSKEHKRCGTSFVLYVMIISMLFFMCIRVESVALRIALRLILIPAVSGVAYEWIRLAGRSKNPFVLVLSKPGLWMQALTTKEPDDEMLEVAIQSVEAVFDWKAFYEGGNGVIPMKEKPSMITSHVQTEADLKEEWTEKSPKANGKPAEHRPVAVLKKASTNVRRGVFFKDVQKKIEEKEVAEDTQKTAEVSNEEEKNLQSINEMVAKATKQRDDIGTKRVSVLKKADKVRRPLTPIEELRRDTILQDSEEDDEADEILRALDKFFDE